MRKVVNGKVYDTEKEEAYITMKRFIFSMFVIIIVICIALPGSAGELYIWTDENGVKQITDKPPANKKIKVQRESFIRPDPKEIEASKEKQRRRAAELEREEKLRKWQGDVEEAKRKSKEQKEEWQKQDETRRRDEIDHRLKQIEIEKERRKREYNNARNEYNRLFWKQLLGETEHEERRLREELQNIQK